MHFSKVTFAKYLSAMPSLCILCSQISFLDLPPFPPSLAGYHVPFKADSDLLPFVTKVTTTPEKRIQRIPVGSLGLAHHPSLAALWEAAKICEICALLEQSVDRVRATLEEAKKSNSYVAFDRTGPPTWEFFLSKRGKGEHGLLAWSMSEKGLPEAYLLGAIGFCVDDGKMLYSRFSRSQDPRLQRECSFAISRSREL
jgi:hypothetical protein